MGGRPNPESVVGLRKYASARNEKACVNAQAGSERWTSVARGANCFDSGGRSRGTRLLMLG